MKKRIILVLSMMLLLSPLVSASLGLSPAYIKMNFVPNYEDTFTFQVGTDKPNQEIGLYAKGNLAKYVSINKERVEGPSKFEVELDLPNDIERPGKHRILIGAKEVFTEREKEVQGTIGTRIKVQAVIEVFVPYPGKYLIVDLKGENANVGKPVKFLLDIDNKGKQNVTMKPRIEIYSNDNKLETLNFYERKLPTKESITLQKVLNTEGYSPGDYQARAIIDYGKLAKDNESFKLGHLYVRVINHTKKVKIDKIRDFKVEVENRWNNKLDHIHADVTFLNNSEIVTSFKTSPTSLKAWEEKELTGYFDSSKFNESIYDTNITLHYSGESSYEMTEVEFYREKQSNFMMTALIIAGIVILIIILIVIGLLIWRYKNEKE